MCEYCGCQAVPTIRDLTREHDLVVELIGEARSVARHAALPELAELSCRIAAILGPHTTVEEEGLFPALDLDFPGHIAILRDEHRQIEAVLDEARLGIPADPAWPARLIAALGLLRQHILKEQDGIFPAALATLHPGDWDTAEAVRARVGSLLPQSSA